VIRGLLPTRAEALGCGCEGLWAARCRGVVERVMIHALPYAHDPKGEMFGFPRLRALVAEHAEERSLGDFLLEELYSFVGEGWEQEDDITLLTLERSPT
jgi:hypothetical protein